MLRLMLGVIRYSSPPFPFRTLMGSIFFFWYNEWLTMCRASLIAQKPMKGSTLSAGLSVLGSKWRITTETLLSDRVYQAFSDRHSLSDHHIDRSWGRSMARYGWNGVR